MSEANQFLNLLPSVNESSFANIALQAFRFQYKNNLLYRTYSHHLGKDSTNVKTVESIPFLPITFFKTHHVISGMWKPEIVFASSATTGSIPSKHLVMSQDFYIENTVKIFERFYGSILDYHFLALLPSYLERSGSSLITMIDHFIKSDTSGESGYYLKNYDELLRKIDSLKGSKKKTLLWGVSFGLLDFAETNEVDLAHGIIMETGGMKGRRKEWVREELHDFLCRRFNTATIHSEYGMTELFSQAYSNGHGYYNSQPWMKVIIRDINDPFNFVGKGKIGAINVIDLANIHSCSFIETQDLGSVTDKGFKVHGRMDNSDMRGCNLMVG